MMGYTHAAIGAAGALTIAALFGDGSPELFMCATISGAIGGVVVDIDTKDHLTNPKVTDAGRTRLAIVGLFGIGVILDWIFKTGIITAIIDRNYYALGGLIAFLVLALIGFFTPHRTFSHSLLFVLLSSVAVYFIYPKAVLYYCIGCILHIVLDMLNFPFNNHGIWLLYPIKTGKGIAFGLCRAGRTGNKVCYYIGITVFFLMSAFYLWQIRNIMKSIAPVVIIAYTAIVLFFVRRKTEKEQRHIMHIRGEI